MAGLLERAVSVNRWPSSLEEPAEIPLKTKRSGAASSRIVCAGIAARLGAWLAGTTVTAKAVVAELIPPFAVPPLSKTVTVIVAFPLVFGIGVKVNVPLEFGLE